MRHQKKKQLNLNQGRRRALSRSLLTGLFTHGAIKTSHARARYVQSAAEKLITMAKDGSVPSRRRILAVVQDRGLVKKLVDEIAPRYAGRNGGYTQLLKLSPRKGDGCPLSILTLLA